MDEEGTRERTEGLCTSGTVLWRTDEHELPMIQKFEEYIRRGKG